MANSVSAQSQRTCGTDALHQAALSQDPRLRQFVGQQEIAYQQYLQRPQRTASGMVRTIPVVVHIIQSSSTVQISDARVQSQIDVLNEDFRKMNADTTLIPSAFQNVAGDCEIEFCLATIDPNGCPTTGINRIVSPSLAVNHSTGQSAQLKGLIQWDPYMYLNIWVPESMGNLLGYATFPTNLNSNPQADGVVMNAQNFGRGNGTPTSSYNLGRTGTHEVGHWLGLFHTFENGCAGTDSATCQNAGDRVCDTPPSDNPNFGCPGPQNTCTETPTDLPDQTMNFMDYVDDRCMAMYTLGQKARMDFFLNGTRQQIWSAANLTATGCDGTTSPGCPPVASFNASQTSGCPGLQVSYTDLSIGPATSWDWSFPGGTPAVSTLPNPVVTYATAGTYPVTLIVTNGVGSDTLLQMAYISVANAASLPFQESFEGISAGFPPGWGAIDPDQQGSWEFTNLAASDGQNSMVIRHFSQTSVGSNYDLLSTPLDLSNVSVAQLSFDWAYKRRFGLTSDSLKILVSSDCGMSWNLEWELGGPNLATTGGLAIASEFVPTSGQWLSDTLSLASYLGATEVRVMFRFTGYGGQSLYVDHINLGQLVSNDAPDGPQNFQIRIYPNPAKQAPQVEADLLHGGPVEIRLLNLTGKTLYQENREVPANGLLKLTLSPALWEGLSPGVYFLKVGENQENTYQKVIKM